MSILKKISFFLAACAVSFGAYTPPASSTSTTMQTVVVNSSGSVLSPVNFISANALATTTYAINIAQAVCATASPVASVNGMTGSVQITAAGIGALPATVSNLTLSTLAASNDYSETSVFSAGGILTYEEGYTTVSMTPTGIRASLFGSTTFAIRADSGDATLSGTLTASNIVSGALTVSSLTVSPTQWYAVFILTPPDYTSRWTDFILKGAEQTGATATAIYDLKFCYISSDPEQSVYTQTYSAKPIPYFTNNTSVDGRVWIKQFVNRSISQMMGANARVGGWCVVVRETGSWFNPYNRKLVWSWVPSTATELLSYSGNVIWSPIQPSYWTQTPPSP